MNTKKFAEAYGQALAVCRYLEDGFKAGFPKSLTEVVNNPGFECESFLKLLNYDALLNNQVFQFFKLVTILADCSLMSKPIERLDLRPHLLQVVKLIISNPLRTCIENGSVMLAESFPAAIAGLTLLLPEKPKSVTDREMYLEFYLLWLPKWFGIYPDLKPKVLNNLPISNNAENSWMAEIIRVYSQTD